MDGSSDGDLFLDDEEDDEMVYDMMILNENVGSVICDVSEMVVSVMIVVVEKLNFAFFGIEIVEKSVVKDGRFENNVFVFKVL